jgi:hypothetical protein
MRTATDLPARRLNAVARAPVSRGDLRDAPDPVSTTTTLRERTLTDLGSGVPATDTVRRTPEPPVAMRAVGTGAANELPDAIRVTTAAVATPVMRRRMEIIIRHYARYTLGHERGFPHIVTGFFAENDEAPARSRGFGSYRQDAEGARR